MAGGSDGSNSVSPKPTITQSSYNKMNNGPPGAVYDVNGNVSTADTTAPGAVTYVADPSGTGNVRETTHNEDGTVTARLITPTQDPATASQTAASNSNVVAPPVTPTQTDSISPASNIVQPPPAASPTAPAGGGNTPAYNAAADSAMADNAAATNTNNGTNPASPTAALISTTATNVGVSSVSTTPLPANSTANTIDIIYQDIKIYIEGVQVPFESASVTQSMGNLPTATIQIPPAAGLMDIARYYQPKVHIFYTDAATGGDRLLFWGHISKVSFASSQQSGQKNIQFMCTHKNTLVEQVTMEWSGGGSSYGSQGINLTDTNPNQAAFQFANFNSEFTLQYALQGINGIQSSSDDLIDPSNPKVISADPTKMPQKYSAFLNRYIGMPSIAMNLWNQAKREVFAAPKLNLAFSKMFLPLMEDGLGFFERISGHYFLETQIQNSKQMCCTDNPKPELNKPMMLPPSYRMDIFSAYQGQLSIQTAVNQIQFSNENMNFYELFYGFLYNVGYDMITLASPAEVQVDPSVAVNLDDPKTWRSTTRMAIETVMKPQMPFYYAPLCNVLLPNLYHSIQVNQDEDTVPTRITAVSTAAASMSNAPDLFGVNYRGPQSIRESIALGKGLGNTAVSPNLADTTGPSYNVPGKYELGHGIKNKKIQFPFWLSSFCASAFKNSTETSSETFPIQGTMEYKNLQSLQLAWIDRYGYNAQPGSDGKITPTRSQYRDTLNPYTQQSGLHNYERLLFSAADYDFTKEITKARNGVVESVFNPYIIPGYPMDIIAKSPEDPCFHAMCASVTHSLTSRSIGTSISFMAATTYTEMSNYYIQPTSPWLQTALKLINVAQSATSASSTTTGIPNDQQASTPVPDPLTSSTNNPGTVDKKLVNSAPAAVAGASGVQITASQFSTNYGLTADPAYDSNAGDVTSTQQTIINNPRAKQVADQFYQQVLGVGAANPSDIYDFTNGTVKAVSRSKGIWSTPNNQSTSAGSPTTASGGLSNDNLTTVGSLRLISRQIECKDSIADKFKIKFIDLTPTNYTGQPNVYQNQVLTNSQLLEPGASMFLDYQDVSDFLNNVPPNADSGIVVERN